MQKHPGYIIAKTISRTERTLQLPQNDFKPLRSRHQHGRPSTRKVRFFCGFQFCFGFDLRLQMISLTLNHNQRIDPSPTDTTADEQQTVDLISTTRHNCTGLCEMPLFNKTEFPVTPRPPPTHLNCTCCGRTVLRFRKKFGCGWCTSWLAACLTDCSGNQLERSTDC